MPLVFGTLKTSKKDFHRSQHQKRKDEIRPFSILAFLQPTRVDKDSQIVSRRMGDSNPRASYPT